MANDKCKLSIKTVRKVLDRYAWEADDCSYNMDEIINALIDLRLLDPERVQYPTNEKGGADEVV